MSGGDGGWQLWMLETKVLVATFDQCFVLWPGECAAPFDIKANGSITYI